MNAELLSITCRWAYPGEKIQWRIFWEWFTESTSITLEQLISYQHRVTQVGKVYWSQLSGKSEDKFLLKYLSEYSELQCRMRKKKMQGKKKNRAKRDHSHIWSVTYKPWRALHILCTNTLTYWDEGSTFFPFFFRKKRKFKQLHRKEYQT